MLAAAPQHALLSQELTIPLQRCLAGFLATDLVTDLAENGPFTLLAPFDAAFDDLPWRFDELVANEALIEERFELFEYCVVPGVIPASGPLRSWPTLTGEPIRVGQGAVIGAGGAARIVASVRWRGALVHAIDSCVLPASLLGYRGKGMDA
jgi:uncharacterized surface protein with fasciclin (FAS1) repeats